ncbi:MAG: nickel-dependent hydrogenase large subunit [Nevskiales bacterium]|nr:nickel-dependent hydrogenase large subunit [Nevskiales bacterium]
MGRRIVVGPFNRVEGDLEVALEFEQDRISAAYVNSPLFRGFEQMLIGKHPLDALHFVPRICGICSVAQSAAASMALAQAAGLSPCENGRICAALTQAIENLADHLSHFVLFFMPDFARADYAERAWSVEAVERYKAIAGSARREVVPARTRLLETMGLLAGRWPHTGSLQPGGSARPIDASERLRLYALLRGFRAFLERTLLGDALEAVAAIDSVGSLRAWAAAAPRGDFGRFLRIADDLDLWRLGRATDRYLSYGAYLLPEGPLYPGGVWDGGPRPLHLDAIAEDVSHAWMGGDTARPRDGSTVPMPDKPGAYSWCKAPRLAGEVVEVGALARQVVAGHPLARDMIRHGGSVAARVVARLLEMARTLPEMERWVMRLQPDEPFCAEFELPQDADGVGLVEAARGSLGHWLSIRRGRIASYQIIAPTTWNFSPRDAAGQPGALEQALVGVAAGADRRAPVSVQHIVRSFDPCMVCTVH